MIRKIDYINNIDVILVMNDGERINIGKQEFKEYKPVFNLYYGQKYNLKQFHLPD